MADVTLSAAKQAKAAQVEAVKESISKSTSIVFVSFRGVDVETITDLRARFRKAGVEYRVIKNKLIRQALVGHPIEGNDAVNKTLVGETGVAISFEDPSSAAKVIRDFRKLGDKQGKLEVKLAVLDSEVIPGAKVESDLAAMPGKDELRAMLLATLQAPAQNLVMQLAAASQNLVYVLDAQRRKQAGE